MSDQIESPTFHNQHLQSSISNPTFDKGSQLHALHPSSSRQANYNTIDSAASFKNPDSLGMHDLSSKAQDYRPYSNYDKPTRSSINDLNDTLQRRLTNESPSANAYYSRSMQNFNYPSSPQHNQSTEHENIKYSTISAQPGYEQAEQARYAKLESEIQNLKKTLLEKFENNRQGLTGNKKRTKVENEINKNESDEEENGLYKMESKRLKSRGKDVPHREHKDTKPPKTAANKNTKQLHKPNEETTGPRKDAGNVRRGLNKDDKKKGEKTSLSKARSGAKPKKSLEEKYEGLKEKNQDLKDVCREYVEKAHDLEEILKSKDRQLESYDEEIKKKHDMLIEKGELAFELKRQLTNREERIERINRDFEIRFREQEERIEKQQQVAKEKEAELRSERDNKSDEVKSLNLELDIMTKKEAVTYKNKEIVQGELDAIKNELNSKITMINELAKVEENRGREIVELRGEIKKAKAENEEFRERIREIEQAKREIDDISTRDRKMYEEHINRLSQEREREVLKQKERFEELKEELKRTSVALDKTKEEKQGFENTAERLERQKLDVDEDLNKVKERLRQADKDKELLEKEIDRLRLQKEEGSRNAQFELERANRLESDNRKLDSGVKTLEGRLEAKEKEAAHLQDMNEQMTDEIRGLIKESERSRDYLIKLERDIATLESERGEDTSRSERRIEKLTKQVQLLEEENRMLKTSESRLSRELDTVKEEKEKYRIEYRELRQTNKTLEKDLKELDEKVKTVIMGRSTALSDHNHHHSRDATPQILNSASKSGSKLKVLDEIQDMITGYRSSQARYERNDG